MNSTRRGFTLIELVVVMSILVIMAGFAVLSVRSHIENARWTRCFEQLEQMDRLARITARSESASYELRFVRSKGSIEMRAVDAIGSRTLNRDWKLPKGAQFSSFRERSGGTRTQELTVQINPNGQSSTYAVAIQASSGPPRWFVKLGFSGQPIRMENADDVAALFPR